MLLQIDGESFTYSLLNSTRYFAVTQLRFGLSLKLRLSYLDGNDGCKPLSEVLSVDFYLCLLQHLVVLGIFFQGTGQCTTKAC